MFCSFCWGLSVLRAQLHRDYVMPDAKRRLNATEAVRIFMASYASTSSER
jgi:hypothetical protein